MGKIPTERHKGKQTGKKHQGKETGSDRQSVRHTGVKTNEKG